MIVPAKIVSKRPHAGRARCRRSQESGYVYLMALFMVLLVIVGSTIALTNLSTEVRREREDEMIWRGKQYIRAFKLYYRRTGHYPPSIDDVQNGLAGVHFLREAYGDPMNKNGEGKWRFIYINASGAIIGSSRYATMQQMAILDMNGGMVPGAQGNGAQDPNVTPVAQPDQGNCTTPSPTDSSFSNQTTGSSGFGNSTVGGPGGNQGIGGSGLGSQGFGNQGFGNSGNQGFGNSGFGSSNNSTSNQPGSQANSNQNSGCPNQQNGPQVPGQSNPLLTGVQAGVGQPGGAPGVGGFGLTQQSMQALLQMQPTGPVDSPVIGGYLVGVGSTVDRKSIKAYKRATNYKDWEFIWNPMEQQALAMQQQMNQAGMGNGLGLGLGQPNGSSSNGFGNSAPGGGSPPGPTGSTSPPPNSSQPPQQ